MGACQPWKGLIASPSVTWVGVVQRTSTASPFRSEAQLYSFGSSSRWGYSFFTCSRSGGSNLAR